MKKVSVKPRRFGKFRVDLSDWTFTLSPANEDRVKLVAKEIAAQALDIAIDDKYEWAMYFPRAWPKSPESRSKRAIGMRMPFVVEIPLASDDLPSWCFDLHEIVSLHVQEYLESDGAITDVSARKALGKISTGFGELSAVIDTALAAKPKQ